MSHAFFLLTGRKADIAHEVVVVKIVNASLLQFFSNLPGLINHIVFQISPRQIPDGISVFRMFFQKLFLLFNDFHVPFLAGPVQIGNSLGIASGCSHQFIDLRNGVFIFSCSGQ